MSGESTRTRVQEVREFDSPRPYGDRPELHTYWPVTPQPGALSSGVPPALCWRCRRITHKRPGLGSSVQVVKGVSMVQVQPGSDGPVFAGGSDILAKREELVEKIRNNELSLKDMTAIANVIDALESGKRRGTSHLYVA